MNPIIEALLTTSAVYIIIVAAVGAVLVISASMLETKEVKTNIVGLPALLLALSAIICAISTLALLPS